MYGVQMVQKHDVTKHVLVPKHSLVSEKEKKALTDKYSLSGNELPRILKTDPAIQHLKAKEGDVIKIVRKSLTAGETVFYRRVVSL